MTRLLICCTQSLFTALTLQDLLNIAAHSPADLLLLLLLLLFSAHTFSTYLLLQDLCDLERRAQAAELRHQELSARLPEATRPLLRQISALQDASTAQVRLQQQLNQGRI
jgi:hypothetical protein